MEQTESQNEGQAYTVVARRYRPRAFDELIGQGHVAQALSKAIETGRVGHAYLFTGARGVGKTSTARIFAKVLNTQEGTEAGLADEISQAIDSGEDMDTIEIDGASNRGIEEIRQLRANVNVRPSRARFKIYIIDEVHMLTNQAFNALLKTLEEPPAHVKFIFCTTDPDKIPITVLSRCQRFDFAPVKFEAIQKRLGEIATAEGFQADDEALALLARRAAGSMRDSQSLLEQVMSFSSERITAEQVHELLGTADEGRLLEITNALADKKPLESLKLIAAAIQAGTDPGQFAEQLLNYFRDLMAIGIGGGPDVLLIANPAGIDELKVLADRIGVQSLLTAIGILDEAIVRMRASVSAATLFEVAVVQICQLEQLASIPALLELVAQGAATGAGEKKKSINNPAAAPSAGHAENVGGANGSQTAAQGAATQATQGTAESAASESVPEVDSVNGSGIPASDSARQQKGASEPASPTEASTGSTSVDASLGQSVESSSKVEGSKAATAASPALQNHQLASTAVDAAPGEPAMATATVAPTQQSIATATSAQPTSSSNGSTPAASHPEANATTVATSSAGGSSHSLKLWKQAVGSIDGMLSDVAGLAIDIQTQGADSWKVIFPPGGQKPREYCEVGERRAVLQQTLAKQLGREIQLQFAVKPGEIARAAPAEPQSTNRVKKMRELAEDPYVKKLCEVLGGEIIKVDSPR